MKHIKLLTTLLILILMISNCKNENKNPLLSEFTTIHKTTPFSIIKDKHFIEAFNQGIKEGNNDIKLIIENKKEPTFGNTIVTLDNSGELLSKVSGVFFNLLGAETNDKLQEIAEEISPLLTKYDNDIYMNSELYSRVDAVYKQIDDIQLNAEQTTLLKETYKSFIENGANLNKTNKKKFCKINEELSLLSLKFDDNIRKETNKYSLHITDISDLNGLPEGAIEAARGKAKDSQKDGWIIDITAPSYGPFLKYADNRELRKKLYYAYNSKCIKGDSLDNRDNVKKIIKLRLEKATLLGYDNYASYALEDRMAENVENVYNLLNKLESAYKTTAIKEIQELEKFAKSLDFKGKLQYWDLSYYSNKLKEKKYSINDEMLKPYFKLKNVINGVFNLATELYGITFKENKDIEVYNKDVTAYEVFDKNNKFLAIFYTDFYPRKGKQDGAWMNSFFDQKIIAGKNIRPHIINVMNFTKPTETKPSLLTFNEVTTLLHEFGHALHGMLANTTYAGLSGTNVARDFVELPSQLMENYAFEKEFLDKFAVNYKTGEKIPQELIDKIIESNNFMVGYNCYRQLGFGLLDMAYHTLSEIPEDFNVLEFERGAKKEVSLLPEINELGNSASFSHIFSGGYAAGYYGYKWAEVLDADAFAVFKKAGIFNKEVAKSFKENILEKGGTENAMILYKRFKGIAPTIDALLLRDGIK